MDRKERKKAYMKAYREANKEKRKEKNRQFREANKEYIKQYNKRPANKKSKIIAKWKNRGLLCEDYDSLYDRYIESTNCEECGCEYGVKGDGSGTFRCCDHDHETGLFRNFLCNTCNTRRGE